MSLPAPFRQHELRRLLAAQDDDFVFLETSKMLAGNHHSLLFRKPVDRLVCTVADWPDFLARCEEMMAQGHYLAGWFAYEFGYFLEPVLQGLVDLPDDTILADLAVFTDPAIFDHTNGQWDQQPDFAAGFAATPFEVDNITLSQDEGQYIEHIRRIKEYIRAGDTYQVNYTLKLFFDFIGQADELYLHLRANQGVGYGAYMRQGDSRILSFSPELFFQKEGTRCTVRPMKGTIKRGRTPQEDAKFIDFLHHDPKNRSENVMIVDLLRNDLGRLADMATVQTKSLFDVETYESLHQMTSTITAQLPEQLPLAQLFTALFPCGSITGAPKIRTMEIIRELETAPRGLYTGAIGYLSPNGDGCFNVPIRTIVLDDGHGEMGIGSGIVADSDPESEWQECNLKAHFLTHSQHFELIETLLWQPDSGYWLLEYHLDRLLTSARHFNFVCSDEQLRDELACFTATLPAASQRVRLLLNSEGRCTLSAVDCSAPLLITLRQTTVASPSSRCSLASEVVSAANTFLYHKTTNRELFNRSWQQAQEQGLLDTLFCNEQGQLTEGAISSIFIRQGDKFYTPPLACGLLAGVLRRYLLVEESSCLSERIITPADLYQADAIFLGNSVRGLIPVELVSC